MNLLLLVYFFLFAVIQALSIWCDVLDRRPAWFVTSALVSTAILLWLVSAHSNHYFGFALGQSAGIAYGAAMGWESFKIVEKIRWCSPAISITPSQDLVIENIFIGISLPGFILAGRAALNWA